MSVPEAFTIAHLAGVAVGLGGAVVSDSLFLASAANRRISRPELRFLKLGGRLVWIGLVLIFISGAGLVAVDPTRYLGSEEFLAKMTAVGVLVANGVVFHRAHIPALAARARGERGAEAAFRRKRPWVMLSGAISAASWLFALVLGAMNFSFGYAEFMAGYAAMVAVAAAGALLFGRRIAPTLGE